MDSQKNVSVVKNLFNEVFSQGMTEKLDLYLTEDVKLTDPAAPNFSGGLSAFKQKEQSYESGFPGKQVEIDDIFAADDNRVVVRWTCTATHKGMFDDVSPTNKTVKVSGISIYMFKGDKISEVYQNWDRLGLFEQLGVVDVRATAPHR